MTWKSAHKNKRRRQEREERELKQVIDQTCHLVANALSVGLPELFAKFTYQTALTFWAYGHRN